MPARPTITTERLILRPFEPGDAAAVAELCADKEIAANTLFIPHPYSLADAETWLAGHQETFDSGRGVQFAVTLRSTGALAGSMDIVIRPEHDRADLGYWIGRPWWNQGFATEAARAIIHYGFHTLGLNRIHAYHYLRNPASGRVMEKAGMRYEGLLRQHVKKWGGYEDCACYGITRSDYDALRRP